MMFRKLSLLTVTAAVALSAFAWSGAAEAARPVSPAELKARVALKPDLIIKSLGLRKWGECKPYSAVYVWQVTVANVGNAPSPSSAALGNKALVQVMEKNGSGPWGNGAFLPAIAPGASATVNVPVYYLIADPGHMTADAPHKFSAVADPLKLVAEKDEYNNRSQPVTIAAPKGCPGGGGVRPGPGGLKNPGAACKGAKPVLQYTGSQPYSTGAGAFVRHRMVVKNWKAFCPAMFNPAPNLPPCGANANSSRTWVDIFDSSTGQRIYGFCAFGQPQDLTKLWFATPKGKKPPKLVHIVIHDRQANKKYFSNKVAITP